MPSGKSKIRSLKNLKSEMKKVSCPKKFPIVLLERLTIKTDKATSKVTFKKLRSKIVNIKQTHKETAISEPVNSLLKNKNQNLYPKVVLERISFNSPTKISCKKNVTANFLSSINKENLTSNITNQQVIIERIPDFEKKSNNQNSNSINLSNITKLRVQAENKSDVESNVVNSNVIIECLPDDNVETVDVLKESKKSVDESDDEIIDVLTIDEENTERKEKDIEEPKSSEQHNTPENENIFSRSDVNERDFSENLNNKDDDCIVIPQNEDNLEKTAPVNENHDEQIVDVNSEKVTSKTSSVSEFVDSSDVITGYSSDEEESSIASDDEGSNTSSESIGEFSPFEENSYQSENSEKPDSNSGNQVDKPVHSLDKRKSLFISLKDAFESISADMNHLDEAVCTYEPSFENCNQRDTYIEESYIEESPEIQAPQYIDCGNDYAVVDQSQNILSNIRYNPDTATLEKRLNFIRGSQLLNSNQQLNSNQHSKSNSQSHPNDESSRKRISIRVARCPKCKKRFTDVNFAKHWDMCRIGPFIPCKFCDIKFKQKRSLISHMKRHHYNKVHEADVSRIANIVYLKAKAALDKLKKLPTEMLEIQVPDFIRVYCKICLTFYTSLPQNYRKCCSNCSKVLTYHCNRCHTHQLTSHHMAAHIRSECVMNENLGTNCIDCNYVTLRTSQLQETVQRQHVSPPVPVFVSSSPSSSPPPSSSSPAPPLPPPAAAAASPPPLPPPPTFQLFQDVLSRPTPEEDPLIQMFNCNRCNRNFRTRSGVQKHAKYCGRGAYLHCKFCPYRTMHKSSISVHMQQHVLNNEVTVIDNLPCMPVRPLNITPDVSLSKKKEHERIIDNMIAVCCPKCKYKLPQSMKFKVHVCTACGILYHYKCTICQTASGSYGHLTHHVARHHAPKIFTCPTCKKKYSYETDYLVHVRSCEIHYCSKCPYSSPHAKNLQLHRLRRHPENEDLNYVCKRCPQRFSLEVSLKQHLKICGVEPKLECAHCPYRSHAKYTLKRHLQSVHASELFTVKFTCNFCKKNFFNLFFYESHVENCPEKMAFLRNPLLL